MGQCRCASFEKLVNVVADNPEHYRNTAGTLHQGRQRIGIDIADLAGSGDFIYRDHFIAGGDNGDNRPAKDTNRFSAEGRQKAGFLGSEFPAAGEHNITLLDIFALCQHVLSRSNAFVCFYRDVVNRLGMFNHDNTVGPIRQHTAGGYFSSFTGCD